MQSKYLPWPKARRHKQKHALLPEVVFLPVTRMSPRWPQEAPSRPQDGPKRPPAGPKMGPRWPQDGPREPQDGGKIPQDTHLGAKYLDIPENTHVFNIFLLAAAPRWPQKAPNWPKDGPKMATSRPQDGSKTAQDGAQRGPICLPRDWKTPSSSKLQLKSLKVAS